MCLLTLDNALPFLISLLLGWDEVEAGLNEVARELLAHPGLSLLVLEDIDLIAPQSTPDSTSGRKYMTMLASSMLAQSPLLPFSLFPSFHSTHTCPHSAHQ